MIFLISTSGIEPSPSECKARALPLCYAVHNFFCPNSETDYNLEKILKVAFFGKKAIALFQHAFALPVLYESLSLQTSLLHSLISPVMSQYHVTLKFHLFTRNLFKETCATGNGQYECYVPSTVLNPFFYCTPNQDYAFNVLNSACASFCACDSSGVCYTPFNPGPMVRYRFAPFCSPSGE